MHAYVCACIYVRFMYIGENLYIYKYLYMRILKCRFSDVCEKFHPLVYSPSVVQIYTFSSSVTHTSDIRATYTHNKREIERRRVRLREGERERESQVLIL